MAEGVEKTHVYSSVSASATAAGGLPGHVRSYSPASVLECNSPMAFPDHPHQQHMVSHPQSSAATPTASASVVSAGSGLVRQEVELQEEVPAPQSEVARREFAEEEDCDALKSQCSKRRKTVQSKKVIYVPIGPSDGRQKNDGPPSDMWAWRKYGQKPIKGSPYPRGYYRCSSSKGCGARKQVERSCTDPTMLIITYTSEHNHPWPLNRSSNNNSNTNNVNNNNSCCTSNSNSATTISPRQPQFHKESSFSEQEDSQFGKEGPLSEEEHRVAEEKMVRSRNPVAETEQRGDAYPCNSPAESLFSLLVSSSSSPLETMVSDMGGFEQLQSSESGGREAAEPNVCSRREEQEEEEDFYADLGELPESASVFSRGSSFFEVDEDSKNSNSNCVSGMDHRSGLLSWPPGG